VARHSAGLLLFRTTRTGELEVLLVHPGGPFWAGRDAGAWSIPKGEYLPGEDPAAVAEREFGEELGLAPPAGPRLDLGEITQAGGKRVRAWAVEGDLEATSFESNTTEVEWPPRSGRRLQVPEVDRAEWTSVGAARERLNRAQVQLLDRLLELVGGSP